MDDISLQDPSYEMRTRPQPKQSGITRLVIKLGLAKDEAGAQRAMIIIAVIAFAVSIFFFISSQPHRLTPEEAAKLLPG